MIHSPIEIWTNHEREFRIYSNQFYKRSLRADEYKIDFRNKPYVPYLGPERLLNEAACLQFIRQKTNIPVPDVLEAYEDDGSFVLITRLLQGVPMNELSSEEQAIVMKEVDSHLQTLQTLRSNRVGGPTGIICPPPRATQYFPKDTVWPKRTTRESNLVFCHCDLSQSNIIVDPKTLKIEGIIDWEYGGYWPTFFESPYFRDPRPSGAQFRAYSDNYQLVDFLKDENIKVKEI
jgi:hypothetical protein